MIAVIRKSEPEVSSKPLVLFPEQMTDQFQCDDITLHKADVSNLYHKWPSPTTIISDGAYGLGLFEGEPQTHDDLVTWYEPHIKAWTERATPQTTLWFWNSELGWASVHPLLIKYGWRYVSCHIWDKGIAHVAGNTNTQTLRKFPIVTEVCVQYVKEARIEGMTLRKWLRHEWQRAGLPLNAANIACEVKNAATRKYLTQDHLWYFPPTEAFVKLVNYANSYGKPEGKPYFSQDGKSVITPEVWAAMRAKFYCKTGITNVWHEPPLNGKERIKVGAKSAHLNQKPLRLMQLIIEASSDKEDVIWEPFGGLCSGAIAAHKLGRKCFSAEVDTQFFELAVQRLLYNVR